MSLFAVTYFLCVFERIISMISVVIPVLLFLVCIGCLVARFMITSPVLRRGPDLVAGVTALGTVVTFVFSMVVTIPAGYVGVATLFGDVQQDPARQGMHFANPLFDWYYYDCREKSAKITAGVAANDQLVSTFDVSVQYRIDEKMTPKIMESTGDEKQVFMIHIEPKIRSILREQAKTVAKSEDFFKEETQTRLQRTLEAGLQEFLAQKGVTVSAVLIRDIKLPPTIQLGVEAKKKRDQEAERQEAELRRFKIEQQQKVEQAMAELEASSKDAEKRKLLADAQAYEIMAINKAVAQNPAYIQLEALKALQTISKDPAAKLYFLNGDSPQPMPLMHMGDTTERGPIGK